MGLLEKNHFRPLFFPANFRKYSSTVEMLQQNAYFRWATANNAGKKTPCARCDNKQYESHLHIGTQTKKRRTKKGPERLILVSDAIDTAAVMPFTYFACMYTLIHTSSTTVQLNHCQDDTASMTQKKCQRIRFGIKLVPKVVPFSGTTLHKDSLL